MPSLFTISVKAIQSTLPYSGKLLREKTFANFVVLWLYLKVFSIKFGLWRPLLRQKQAIRESFLCIFHQFAKVFSLIRKFSTIQYLRGPSLRGPSHIPRPHSLGMRLGRFTGIQNSCSTSAELHNFMCLDCQI